MDEVVIRLPGPTGSPRSMKCLNANSWFRYRSKRGKAMIDRPDGSDQAPDHDVPIPYRERISTYYKTLGYGAPYRWAHFAEVPFTPLKKKLAASRIGLITTAAPFQPGKGDQG